MAEQSKIQWCDSTLNFWEGCTKVSAGCQNCYAEARDKRFTGGKLWGKGAPRRKSKSAVKDALAYNRKPWICPVCGHAMTEDESKGYLGCPNKAEQKAWLESDRLSPMPPPRVMHVAQHHRRRIFSLSLGDWLDDEVSIEWLAEMLDTIRQCDQVTWILCTKRPENFTGQLNATLQHNENNHGDAAYHAWVLDWITGDKVPSNIILLTSVENQEQADKRIPELLKIPAACRGLSLEPLLGPVDISQGTYASNGRGLVWDAFGKPAHIPHCDYPDGNAPDGPGISWLIIGGESGPNARPCNVDWIRSLVQQGKAAGVATFVKQLGSEPTFGNNTPIPEFLRHKKGGDPAEWPDDLRVQEWPELKP